MSITDETFRLLLESVEEYAIFVIDPSGIIESWNPGAQRIKGYTAAEAIGQHYSMFFTPEDRAAGKWRRLLDTALAQGRVEDVGWRIRKDGTQFWANVVITTLRDAHGALIGFAKVTRDLTDRAYRAFVEATNGIVWTTDGLGHPNADSPSWRAFTGQTEEEWRGLRGWEPVHPEDQDALRVVWPRAKAAGTAFEAEFRMRRHDGVYVWMACRAVPFRGADGTVREWFGVTFDISTRKAAEEARERALSLWQTTLRSIGDAVISTDAHGRITFLNPVAEQLTGWTSAEATGQSLATVFPIFHEDTRAPVENPVDKVLREGAIVGLANHTVLVRRDRSAIPIDDSAAPIRGPDGAIDGVVLVFRDASEQKLLDARKAFLARVGDELIGAADYRQALAHIATLAVPRLADWCAVEILEENAAQSEQIAVAHVDPAKVEYVRELAKRYPPDRNSATGVPNVLRTGKSELYPVIPIELLERGAVDAEHLRIIKELDLHSAMVVPLLGKDRTFGALSFVYTGQRSYTTDDLAFAEDLARRAALVVERRRLEEEAAVANRAKDEFLAMLGHELRNPLAPILTSLQLMQLRADPSSEKERAVIERQVNHLITLVDDLLDVSRITRGMIKLDRGHLEIATVIARAIEMASPLLERRVHRLHVQVPRTGLGVDADPARLAQVFSNLLSNAAKYTDPGGDIRIEASNDGGEVVVAVSDSGVGIAAEMLPTIFDMFVQERQTIERSQGGLGLGLNIVRSLVTMHGGSVVASSAGKGHGSTFVVRLPAHEDTRVAAAEPPAPPIAEPIIAKRLLIVDDNEDAATMLADILRSYGYQTHAAFDGPSALQIAREHPPDLALLDIGLPVMDGYELALALRATSLVTPRLVALTGYGQDKDHKRSQIAGFDRHLVKPVDLKRLRAVITELLG